MTKPTNLQEKPFSGRDENGLKPSEWIEKRAEEIEKKLPPVPDNYGNYNRIFRYQESFKQAIIEQLDELHELIIKNEIPSRSSGRRTREI